MKKNLVLILLAAVALGVCSNLAEAVETVVEVESLKLSNAEVRDHETASGKVVAFDVVGAEAKGEVELDPGVYTVYLCMSGQDPEHDAVYVAIGQTQERVYPSTHPDLSESRSFTLNILEKKKYSVSITFGEPGVLLDRLVIQSVPAQAVTAPAEDISSPAETVPVPLHGTRPRIIATTDGEIDDRCSMVRFLMYANEWDIEGIVISSSKFHWKGHNWAGVKWIDEDIDLYAKSYENLKKHDPDFPSPDELKKLVYVGNIDNVGEMDKDTAGSDRIVQILLDDEPGPVYLQAWGGTNTIARALWKIQHQYPDQMEKVSKKAIIYIILDQDKTFREYIQPNWPDLMVLGSFRQFSTIAYHWQRIIPEELHKYYDGSWMNENILQGHGPLCASYEAHDDGRFRSEGDSPSFMHQIRVGFGSLEHPSYGGWGGRFVREKDTENVWRGAQDDGSWSKPIWRWSKAFQNDWAARADWCVRGYDETNHNPKVVVNGIVGKSIVRIQAKPESTIELNAAGSSDPDGDSLSYKWWYYKEPSTYSGEVRIDNADAEKASFKVPYDNQANEFHIILTVRDSGSPNLFAYRRLIVQSPVVVDETPPSSPIEGLDMSNSRPHVVIARTIKGKGVSFIEDKAAWHHKIPIGDQITQAIEELE